MISQELDKMTELAEQYADRDKDRSNFDQRRIREEKFNAVYHRLIYNVNILRARQMLMPLTMHYLDDQDLQDARTLLNQGKKFYSRLQVTQRSTATDEIMRLNATMEKEIKHHAMCFKDSTIELTQTMELFKRLYPEKVPKNFYSRLDKAKQETATPADLNDSLKVKQEAEASMAQSPLKDWQRKLLQKINIGQISLLDLKPEEFQWLQQSNLAASVKLKYELPHQ